MIIVRSPLRITLGGGGTDLPSYYQNYGGFVLSAAINKYVYVTINESFRAKIGLKYSKLEEVDSVDQIDHPVIREAMKLTAVTGHIDIANLSDIPHGTGLGSSGSFTTALLQALRLYKKQYVTRRDLAEEAFHIEAEILKQPVGKQDQYIAAVGGITCFNFDKNGATYTPLRISQETLANLEDGITLFFTGYTRLASNILYDQDTKSQHGNKEMLDNLHYTKELGLQSKAALEQGDLHSFADLMNIHWKHKQKRSAGMTNDHIDELYQLALNNGALGGKLVGAGGGGFLLFYTENKSRLRKAMLQAGLREVRIQFDFEGTSVVVHI